VIGVFAELQAQYATHGIATFPVRVTDGVKKPAIRGWQRIGLPASAKLAEKFAGADAFGFCLGRRSGLTILDVDRNDERAFADALDRHGQTPIVVRSGSGNHQAWYRHNGEPRLIRPEPDKPVDFLGSGFVVAPPSRGLKSNYHFIRGSLDDLDHLPHLRGLPAKVNDQTARAAPQDIERIREGRRNKSLWEICMKAAHDCDEFDALLDVARTRNAEFSPPLSDAEVVGVAVSAWGYTERGDNWLGCGRRVALPHATVDRLAAQHPHAYALLSILKRLHGGRDEFVLAKKMADKLGWSLPTFKAARKVLEDQGEIRCISRGGKGAHDPPRYALK
jgi:hypothetical protein